MYVRTSEYDGEDADDGVVVDDDNGRSCNIHNPCPFFVASSNCSARPDNDDDPDNIDDNCSVASSNDNLEFGSSVEHGKHLLSPPPPLLVLEHADIVRLKGPWGRDGQVDEENEKDDDDDTNSAAVKKLCQ